MKKIIIYWTVCAFMFAFVIIPSLSGCNRRTPPDRSQPSPTAPIQSASSASEPAAGAEIETPSLVESKPDTKQSYIDRVVQDTAAKITRPGMSEYEKVKATFDYMIESTNLTKPVGLDLWRIRGNGDKLPSFVENRSLSVLLYGIGMCEDYAAAFTMLLRGMGFEAEYVPGLTYAANGSGLVDHSWTIAKIDGVWYHLDCQLEDNISRRDTTRYQYFMKSDATMTGSHRWGQNLIDARLLTPEQNAEITRDFLAPPCPKDYPTPPPRTFTSAPMPDIAAVTAAIDAEFRAYEGIHGALPPLELNIIPPVFGLEGYGQPD